MNEKIDLTKPVYYVYRHTKRCAGRTPFYIGVGTASVGSNGELRYYRAYDTKKRSDFWLRTYNKYGRDVQILWHTSDRKEALKKETEFIRLYGCRWDGGLLCNFVYEARDHINRLSVKQQKKVYILRRGSKEIVKVLPSVKALADLLRVSGSTISGRYRRVREVEYCYAEDYKTYKPPKF